MAEDIKIMSARLERHVEAGWQRQRTLRRRQPNQMKACNFDSPFCVDSRHVSVTSLC